MTLMDQPLPGEPLPHFDRAVCRTRPDLPWFGGGTYARITEAVSLCCRCPEIDACHRWAERHDENGIWAGLTQGQREAMRDARVVAR
jgi:hypothetical protein